MLQFRKQTRDMEKISNVLFGASANLLVVILAAVFLWRTSGHFPMPAVVLVGLIAALIAMAAAWVFFRGYLYCKGAALFCVVFTVLVVGCAALLAPPNLDIRKKYDLITIKDALIAFAASNSGSSRILSAGMNGQVTGS